MNHSVYLMILLMFFVAGAGAMERETLTDSGGHVHGGFGGPTLQFTQINDNATWGLGGKGAWLLNHTYYLGGGGFNTFFDEPDAEGLMQHQGFILGYIGRPNRTVHYTAELMFGYGQLLIDKHGSGSDYLYAAEPQLSLSINLASFAVLNLGASYRYISGSDHSVITDSALSGAGFNINVMFGTF